MAMMRYAKAIVQHPSITGRGWNRVRTAATTKSLSANISEQAESILGEPLDLTKYLLTHVTIVASVDTEEVPGVETGLIQEGTRQINRLYRDFRITPETEKYANGNNDGFERRVLLKSYPTFRGGQNYLEHHQVLEHSKGRILDVVARDLGDTVYVDILVATARSNTELVADIVSQRLTTLSMGCFMSGTLVKLFDGTLVPIESVSPDDKVVTHLGHIRRVVNRQALEGLWNIVEVEAQGLSRTIKATANHPFFVAVPQEDGSEAFIEKMAGELHLGDLLIRPLGLGHYDKLPVSKLSSTSFQGFVYDLEVEDHHSYTVEGIAVHNCQIDFSICTQCGNVGTDEPALCEHVRYGKGGRFLDHRGRNAKVVELCGHHTAPGGGVHFIEASWVEVPAFKGAVMRNILEPSQLPSQISRKAQAILSEVPKEWLADPNKSQRQAKIAAEGFFSDSETEATPEAETEKPKDKEPLDKLVDDAEKYILDKADQKIRDKLKGKTETRPDQADLASDTNESLVRSAGYRSSVNALIMARYPVVEWVDHLASLEAQKGLKVPGTHYRAAMLVGPLSDGQETNYLLRCGQVLGKDLSREDQQHLVRIGKILQAHQEVQQVRTVISNLRRSREE